MSIAEIATIVGSLSALGGLVAAAWYFSGRQTAVEATANENDRRTQSLFQAVEENQRAISLMNEHHAEMRGVVTTKLDNIEKKLDRMNGDG